MGDVLKSCPFCGGEAGVVKAVGEWWCKCLTCEVSTRLCGSEERAITAWNNRADADELTRLREERERLRVALEPFARAADYAEEEGLSLSVTREDGSIVVDDEDFRDARSAISSLSQREGE